MAGGRRHGRQRRGSHPSPWLTYSSEELAGIPAVISGRDDGIPEVQELISWVSRFWQDLPERMIFDFRLPTESLKSLWGSVDDVVMGGVSESHLQLLPETGLFAGTVSTANSGGFASIRTRSMEPPLDLRGYQGLVLRVMGDGKRYKLFVRTDPGWDSLAYAHSFDTIPGRWLTVELPFAQMMPLFRAKTIPDAPALDLSRIHSVQLMLSKFEQDKALNPFFTPGPFGLQLDWIGAYGGIPMPQWILISNQDPAPEHDPIPNLHSTGIRYQIVSPTPESWPAQVGSLVGCEGNWL
ncbi:MAG: CIA30 family protein [Synechococcaceae cyanobacterium RM1_1_27]|nr:CIA30 family protein [Synechococcaceae cyanobacterium RM1_1_27]